MAQFLLVRRDDLVHVGLQFSGFRLDQVAGSGGSRPRLVAGSGGALITLTFPPQALSEQDVDPNDLFFRVISTRALPSRVAFAVPVGTALELTAQGVFTALQGPGVTVVTSGQGADDSPTALEIPWRLLIKPVARAGGPVVCDHAVLPASSTPPATATAQVFGLWRARLRATGGDATDAGLAVVALAALQRAKPNPDTTPEDLDRLEGDLKFGIRQRIVAQRSLGRPPAAAQRLELSTIGGSLSVAGKWPSLEWTQDVILGRDRKIRTVVSGVLYPFGHRVQVTTATERQFVVPPPTVPHPHPQPQPHPQPGPHHPPENGNGDPEDPDPRPQPAPSPKRAVAGLLAVARLAVIEPVRRFDANSPLGRQFPFKEVEILGRAFDIDPTSTGAISIIRPKDAPADLLLFPVRCAAANGDVVLHVPMLFVPDGMAGVEGTLNDRWREVARGMPASQSTQAPVPAGAVDHPGVPLALPGVAIHMFPGAGDPTEPRDIHEVYELVIAGPPDGGAFHPIIKQFTAELPAVRMVQQLPSLRVPLAYRQDFIDRGDADVALAAIDPILVDFRQRPDLSGGLIAPSYGTKALSRTTGPVPLFDNPEDAFADTTLLGLPLVDIVETDGLAAPTIVPLAGSPPGAMMTWQLKLKSSGPLVVPKPPAPPGSATVTVTIAGAPPSAPSSPAPPGPPPAAMAPPMTQTMCRVENFDFVLPPVGQTLVRLHFGAVTFTQVPGRPPDLAIEGLRLGFDGALALVNDLVVALQSLIGGGPTIRVLPSGISAGYSLAIPSVQSGDFVLKNVAANFAVDVPFSAGAVTVRLGFARRDNPFNLSVLALGGGGYIDIELGQNGTQLSRFEAAMEFGATLAVDFLIVKAEVHALGGIRFVTTPDTIELDAFIRLGGSVDLLGVVSVSIEMVILLGYDKTSNKLIGHAKIVVDVHVFFVNKSVTLDSGDWVLSGSTLPIPHIASLATTTDAPAPGGGVLGGVITYFKAFAP